MNDLSKEENGFSAVELVLVIIVVVLIGTVGWLVYSNHHKTTKTVITPPVSTRIVMPTKTTAAPPSDVVSSADGKVSVTLPSDWEVSSQYLNNEKPVIGLATNTQGCTGIDDPDPCTYDTNLLPVPVVKGEYGSITDPSSPISNDSWSLTVEKTNQWTSAELANELGDSPSPATITENSNPINGYKAHYNESYYGPPDTNQSVFAGYVIEYNGYLAIFSSHIQPNASQTNPITSDSVYNSQFAAIAQSIKFNF